MNEISNEGMTRRDLIKEAGKLAAVTAIAGGATGGVYAAGSDAIQIALVGCGGRGTGAADDALSSKVLPTKLVAMADVFQSKQAASYKNITKLKKDQVEVPAERQFIGFDAYKHAMDCLKPGDVVILATPPAFRWVHLTYALEKGLNVFMEKPVTVDGPTSRKMFALGEQADKKGLKVAVGLMCRHCKARGELYDRVRNGEIGDITMMRAYRMQGPVASCFSGPKPADGSMSELLYQISRFHSFLWASGGSFSDFFIHNIDECCWIKDAWPVNAKASGGRHFRGNDIDQNFDSYSVEYTFADGTKLFLEGRNMSGCLQEFASYAHGTKGCAVISENSHHPARSRTYSGQDFSGKPIWQFQGEEPNPYLLEWDHFLTAIREGKPYNEVKRGTEASLVTAMGRMAAHTGQLITREDILNCDHEFAPKVDQLAMNSAAPIEAGPDGKYPVPQPGRRKKREF